jgi:hypothetical protein
LKRGGQGKGDTLVKYKETGGLRQQGALRTRGNKVQWPKSHPGHGGTRRQRGRERLPEFLSFSPPSISQLGSNSKPTKTTLHLFPSSSLASGMPKTRWFKSSSQGLSLRKHFVSSKENANENYALVEPYFSRKNSKSFTHVHKKTNFRRVNGQDNAEQYCKNKS